MDLPGPDYIDINVQHAGNINYSILYTLTHLVVEALATFRS